MAGNRVLIKRLAIGAVDGYSGWRMSGLDCIHIYSYSLEKLKKDKQV